MRLTPKKSLMNPLIAHQWHQTPENRKADWQKTWQTLFLALVQKLTKLKDWLYLCSDLVYWEHLKQTENQPKQEEEWHP